MAFIISKEAERSMLRALCPETETHKLFLIDPGLICPFWSCKKAQVLVSFLSTKVRGVMTLVGRCLSSSALT